MREVLSVWYSEYFGFWIKVLSVGAWCAFCCSSERYILSDLEFIYVIFSMIGDQIVPPYSMMG